MTYRGGPSIDRRRRQRRRRRGPRCGAAGGGHLLARPHRSLMRRYGRVRRRVDGLRRRPPPPRPGCRRRALLSGTGRCTAGCSPASTSLDGLVFYCGSSPVRAESFFLLSFSLFLSFFLAFFLRVCCRSSYRVRQPSRPFIVRVSVFFSVAAADRETAPDLASLVISDVIRLSSFLYSLALVWTAVLIVVVIAIVA